MTGVRSASERSAAVMLRRFFHEIVETFVRVYLATHPEITLDPEWEDTRPAETGRRKEQLHGGKS